MNKYKRKIGDLLLMTSFSHEDFVGIVTEHKYKNSGGPLYVVFYNWRGEMERGEFDDANLEIYLEEYEIKYGTR